MRIKDLSLRDLGLYEEQLLDFIASVSGDAVARDRALACAGVYGRYAEIIDAYCRHSGDGVEGSEALRRTVFLFWCSAAMPACLTGVGELGESLEQRIIQDLEDSCAAGELDTQLHWMRGYYNAQYPTVFARFDTARALRRVLLDTSCDDWRRAEPSPRDFNGRGLMGSFWQLVVSRA
ncbi:MAG: hypothetical protein ACRENC_00880 [Gemmatimonadaceae bacterium]